MGSATNLLEVQWFVYFSHVTNLLITLIQVCCLVTSNKYTCMYIMIYIWVWILPEAAYFSLKRDSLGCVVLLCFVVCLTLFASSFLLHMHVPTLMYMYMCVLCCFALLFVWPCLLLSSFSSLIKNVLYLCCLCCRYTFPLVGALPGSVVEQLPEMADLPLLQPAAFPSLSPSHSARPLSSPAHSFTHLDTPQHSGQCSVCSIQYAVSSIQYAVYSMQYEVYSIQYEVYSMQYEVYSIQYTVCSMQYAVYMQYEVCSMQYTVCSIYAVWSIQYTVCSIQYAVCSIQYEVCSMKYTVYSIQYAVCSMQYICSMKYAVCSIQYPVCSIYAVWSIQYTVCSIQYAVCSIQYAVYSMKYAVWSMQYEVCSMQYTVCSIYAVWSIQYAVYSMQYTVCSIQYEACSMQYTVCSIQYAVYSIQYAVYSMKHVVCIIQYTVCSIQYEACSMQYTVCSIQYAVYSMKHVVCSIQYAECTCSFPLLFLRLLLLLHVQRSQALPLARNYFIIFERMLVQRSCNEEESLGTKLTTCTCACSFSTLWHSQCTCHVPEHPYTRTSHPRQLSFFFENHWMLWMYMYAVSLYYFHVHVYAVYVYIKCIYINHVVKCTCIYLPPPPPPLSLTGSHQQPNGHIITPTHHHSHSHSHSLVPAAPSPSHSPLPARRPMSSSAPVSPNSTPTHTPSPSPIPPAPHTTPTLLVANGDLTEDHMSHSVSAGNKLSNSPSHRPRVNVRRRSHDPVTAIIESGPSFIKRLFPRKKMSIPDNKLSVSQLSCDLHGHCSSGWRAVCSPCCVLVHAMCVYMQPFRELSWSHTPWARAACATHCTDVAPQVDRTLLCALPCISPTLAARDTCIALPALYLYHTYPHVKGQCWSRVGSHVFISHSSLRLFPP